MAERTRIVVAVNQSSQGYPLPSISSKKAFDWTLEKMVGSNPADFQILLLHVQANREGYNDENSVLVSREYIAIADHTERFQGFNLLDYFVGRCAQAGIACVSWIKITGKEQKDIEQVICDEVERVKPDFLVVGSRGLSSATRPEVPMVSEFCFLNAACPVIVIKREDNEAPPNPVDD